VGVRPDEIVLIDDLARNVEAARRAGWHAVHLTDGSADSAAGQLSRFGLSIPGGH
ncbi:MAG: HAD-IA family hydrolase, partial [Pseudomonadota bacterium]